MPKVGRSLTYDWSWKFSYHQFILKYGNVGNHQRLHGFVGLSTNLVLTGTILRSPLPTFHLCPSPAASSPRLVPPQSHLQGLQRFRDGVRTEMQGSTNEGVHGSLGLRLRRRPAWAPAAREPAVSSSCASTAAEALGDYKSLESR